MFDHDMRAGLLSWLAFEVRLRMGVLFQTWRRTSTLLSFVFILEIYDARCCDSPTRERFFFCTKIQLFVRTGLQCVVGPTPTNQTLSQ